MTSIPAQDQFRHDIAQLTAQVAGRPMDQALDDWLNAEHGAGSATFGRTAAGCKALFHGRSAGWIVNLPQGPIEFTKAA
jgi:hypothetical protein